MADDIEAILDLGILAGAGVAHLLRRNHQPPVEVAVDAPGASRSYDYSVPDRLAPVEAGETVLVEFGRQRQALGIVLGPSVDVTGIELKPLLARVHADGPLVPPLTLAFARWLSQEYLAPPAATLRSMLPPGMLERLELVAELIPGKQPDAAGEDAGHAGAAPEFGRGVGAQRSGSRAAAAPRPATGARPATGTPVGSRPGTASGSRPGAAARATPTPRTTA